MVERRPRPAGRWSANPTGAHFLRARLAERLVLESGVGADDLVLDLGAGLGALTAPLAATGARVVAIESDIGRVRRLRTRFESADNVSVVQGDLRAVPLPRRDFRVVANIPFATTAALLSRLLDPPSSRLVGADLVVQWEAAGRFAAYSHTFAGAWWGARFVLRRMGRLGADCFVPPPSVDAAVLTIHRTPLPPQGEAILSALLRQSGRDPSRKVRSLLSARLGARQVRALGIDPGLPAGLVTADAWRTLVCAVAGAQRPP